MIIFCWPIRQRLLPGILDIDCIYARLRGRFYALLDQTRGHPFTISANTAGHGHSAFSG